MRLSSIKENAFQFFLQRLPQYMGGNGKVIMRHDFFRRAPIWSTFWHHVLYGTPIFDVYTHIAWHWDITSVRLSKQEATIFAPGHWPTYDRYTTWFQNTFERLKYNDPQITERHLDRALVMWGQKS